MKKWVVAVSVGFFLLLGISSNGRQEAQNERGVSGASSVSGGSGEKIYDVTDFNELAIASAFTYTVKQGSEYLVRVTADEDVLSRVYVRKTGSRVSVGIEGSWPFNGGINSPHVEVMLPVLEKLEISGASTGSLSYGASSGSVQGDRLDLVLSGASRIDIDVSCDMVDARVEGASTIDGTILSPEFRLAMSGASKGNVKLNTDTARVNLSGASRLVLEGKGSDLSVDSSGASTFSARDFPVDSADLQVSGASTLEVAASEKLELEASGGSTVRYWGNPQIRRQDISGGSNLRRMD